ncbi:MAG: transglycosylase domain-containing protein [Actinomycetota bacterium]
MAANRTSRRGAKDPRTRGQKMLLRYGWLVPLVTLAVGAGVLAVTYAFASIPLPSDVKLASAAEVYDRNGNLIGIYSGEERRFLIDTNKLPDFIGAAVIAAEDRDFYDHNGISPRGIVRAAWENITGGGISQGGSTITQQYIKNAVLRDPERTITRKIKEAVLAVKLERRYSKKEILGFYLNTIYLGRGAYGIEAAARVYFDKHAPDLTLGEMAYLAGIISAPESYQPKGNQEGARAQRDRVLEAMLEAGSIGQSQADKAMRSKVKAIKDVDGETKTQEAAYFMEWLRKDVLEPEYGSELYTSGFKVYTTLDLGLQSEAEEAVDNQLSAEDKVQAALVSMTPRGEIRALVGGRNFNNVKAARGFNFVSDNGRQPGSAHKPFTLLSAIEQGISPSSRFSGASPAYIEDPICANPDGTPWEVDNYGGSSYGTLDLDQATTNSVNAVYAQLIAEIGPEGVADLLEDFGFSPPEGEKEIPPRCALALGGSDVDSTPLELARAYAGFTARGVLPKVSPVRYIESSEGDCVKSYLPTDQKCGVRAKQGGTIVVEENSADVLNQVLTHVVEGGTATAAAIGRPVAGKTGTTQNNVDAWFAGSVPQLTTVVWMGYPAEQKGQLVPEMRYCSDPELCRPVQGIEVTGGSFPAEIWADFMIDATAELEILSFPTPVSMPSTIINQAPTVPSAEPTEEPSEEPSEEPAESVEPPPVSEAPVTPSAPPPSTVPSVAPSPSAAGGEGENAASAARRAPRRRDGP